MKVTKQDIRRTIGDTDPVRGLLEVEDFDGSIEFVPDSATVTMHVDSDPVIVINGVPVGDDSGQFDFDMDDVALLTEDVDFQVRVDDGMCSYTLISGLIILGPRIP